MIDKIKLKFGSDPSKPALEITAAPINVFVGPNNAGKSKILSELQHYCTRGNTIPSDVILKDLDFNSLPDVGLEIDKYTLPPKPLEAVDPETIYFGRPTERKHLKKNDLVTYLSNPNSKKQLFCSYYLSFKTIKLDGRSRINLVDPQEGGNLQTPPKNNLQILFRDNAKREIVRRIINEAFKLYFVIDPTNFQQLNIRFSTIPPTDEIQERGLHDDAIEFHKRAIEISATSDGVKAFTGIVTTLIAGDPNIFLIDEPEAFLHPSLASKLGKELSSILSASDKTLFVSTHSSHFLMGCIHSGTPINIIRLTYLNGVSTARSLDSSQLARLVRHPLLRSTGVLNGLFYESVIVTEGDADRAFYQEVNERLLTFQESKGIRNCLFLNAQNKQTIHEIVKPLREMGIPCAAIVDVDIVKEGGTVWSNLMKSVFMPDAIVQSSGVTRGLVKSKFDSLLPKDFKKNGGINTLTGQDKQTCTDLFDQLDEYGIFTVRHGELENWLSYLAATSGHSPSWLIEIFEKMGEDSTHPTYVKPTNSDVWEFMNRIKQWVENPSRKGRID